MRADNSAQFLPGLRLKLERPAGACGSNRPSVPKASAGSGRCQAAKKPRPTDLITMGKRPAMNPPRRIHRRYPTSSPSSGEETACPPCPACPERSRGKRSRGKRSRRERKRGVGFFVGLCYGNCGKKPTMPVRASSLPGACKNTVAQAGMPALLNRARGRRAW